VAAASEYPLQTFGRAQPAKPIGGTKFLDAAAEELRRYTSVPSASARASSTSTPRYRTVLSIFVWPSGHESYYASIYVIENQAIAERGRMVADDFWLHSSRVR
jgi:hypothetical protein